MSLVEKVGGHVTHRAADPEVGAMTRALLRLWEGVAGRITDEQVEAALQSQTGLAHLYATLDVAADSIEKATRLPAYSWSEDEAVNAFARIMSSAAHGTLREANPPPSVSADLAARLDISSPFMRRAAQTQTAHQVRQVNGTTKDSIRRTIYDAQRNGTPPETVADRIRRVVGLDSRRARAVDNYRDGLDQVMSGTRDPATIGPRRYRNGRWEGRWTLGKRPGKETLTTAEANKMADQYAFKLRYNRAQTIARTETIRAANEGQQMTWEEMAHRRSLPSDFNRKWVTADDERTCPYCAELDGTVVRLRGRFRVKVGKDHVSVKTPPLHPNCRCTMVATDEDPDSRWLAGIFGGGRSREERDDAPAQDEGGLFSGTRIFGFKPPQEMTESERSAALLLFFASPADELVLAGGYGAWQAWKLGGRAAKLPYGAGKKAITIFERFAVMEKLLKAQGVDMVEGEYLIHGSGLLDGLGMRAASDLDIIASPRLWAQIEQQEGWYVRMAGKAKDHPVLQHPKFDKMGGVEIGIAEVGDTVGGIQVTTADLATNTVRINKRLFIHPDQLAKMKQIALDDGAKVAKNRRDIAFLDHRFTWLSDVRAFGARVNGAANATLIEKKALQQYGLGSYSLNNKLRAGGRFLTKGEKLRVARLDEVISRGSTPHDIKVYRGLSHMSKTEARQKFGSLVGRTVTEDAYTSTGLREAVAKRYGGKTGVYLELDVPAGSPAFYAPNKAFQPLLTPNGIQKLFGDELLLPRGIRWKVTEVVERADGTVLVRGKVIPSALRRPVAPGQRLMNIADDVPPRFPPNRISPTDPNIKVPNPAKPGSQMKVPRPRPGGVGSGPAMSSDLILEKNIADTVARQSRVPGFQDLAGRVDRGALEEIVRRQARTMLDLAERSMGISRQATRHHATWYPFANEWTRDQAILLSRGAKVPITPTGFRAATAALSPGALWDNNVAWARWIAEAITKDVVVTEDWVMALFRDKPEFGWRPHLIGKRLSQLTDEEVAYAVRARHSHDPVRRLNHPRLGDGRSKASPNTMGNIEKAVKVLRDPSHENIDNTLMGMKVRSFFNNLENPLDPIDLSVTVDTHHYGAANTQPYTTGSLEMQNTVQGLTHAPADSLVGVAGTYPIVVDATRLATAEFNAKWGTRFLPDQFQSIVWEMHRAEFPDWFRANKALLGRMMKDIDKVLTLRARGKISWGEANDRIALIRHKHGAPTREDIFEWFKDDVAGRPRKSIKEIRAIKAARRGLPPTRYLEIPPGATDAEIADILWAEHPSGSAVVEVNQAFGREPRHFGMQNRTVDFGGASPQLAAKFAQEIDRLAQLYPETMRSLIKIHIDDTMPIGQFARTGWMTGRLANQMEATPGARIMLNRYLIANQDAYEAMLAKNTYTLRVDGSHGPGFLVANFDTEGVIRHEWAHLFESRMPAGERGVIALVTNVVDSVWGLDATTEVVVHQGKRITRFANPMTRATVTHYLSIYGSGDIAELFAEVIAEAHGPAPRHFAAETWRWFKDLMPEVFR